MVGFIEPQKHIGAHKYQRIQFLNSPSSCASLEEQQPVLTHASIRNMQFTGQYQYNNRPRCVQNFSAKLSDYNFLFLTHAALRFIVPHNCHLCPRCIIKNGIKV